MGQIIDWLVESEQKELFEFVWAVVVTVAFLALAALPLWLMGRGALTLRLAKVYAVLWIVLYATGIALALCHRALRVGVYERPNAFVISNLSAGGLLQAGWSAFAALAVRDFAPGASVWVAGGLYVVGAISCYVTFGVVSSYYTGHLYKYVNLTLGQVSFILFSLWPAAARALYGWFFDLF